MSDGRGSTVTTNWTPPRGWDDFDAYPALSEAIWSGVSEADGVWHYLNPTSEFSIWEYCADGSAIEVEYRGERIVALRTGGGGAERYLLEIAAAFGLIARTG